MTNSGESATNVLVMGVSGAGKTTIAKSLAAALGLPLLDADALHPAENVRKMTAGIPLTDADRWPWLRAIREQLLAFDRARGSVLACSALKEDYRRYLLDGRPPTQIVYLQASRDLLDRRLRLRKGHFMPASLLDSQLATLEEPSDAIVVDAGLPADEVTRRALEALAAKGIAAAKDTGRIFTVGHSTRPVEEFVAMLQGHGVELLVDIRTIPRSRRNPQFGRDTLPGPLAAAGIEYVHEGGLGGLRKPQEDSPNAAWRNEAFRGYADYMQADAFAEALERIIELGRDHRIALMCAEGNPFRCHRSLVADALLARGIESWEIASPTNAKPHEMTPFAHVEGTRVTYPG